MDPGSPLGYTKSADVQVLYIKRHSVCACVLSRLQLFATSRTVVRQALLSMEFSRQEDWSGLPFPPPLHTVREKESSVTQLCPTLCDPMDCTLPAPLSIEFFRQEYWSGLPCSPSGDLPNPRIEPRSPTLQVDSLSSTREAQEYWSGYQSLCQGKLEKMSYDLPCCHLSKVQKDVIRVTYM